MPALPNPARRRRRFSPTLLVVCVIAAQLVLIGTGLVALAVFVIGAAIDSDKPRILPNRHHLLTFDDQTWIEYPGTTIGECVVLTGAIPGGENDSIRALAVSANLVFGIVFDMDSRTPHRGWFIYDTSTRNVLTFTDLDAWHSALQGLGIDPLTALKDPLSFPKAP